MPDSQAQVRWAHAVLEGSAKGDPKFAQEVTDKMHGRTMQSLPSYTSAGAKKPKAPAKPKRYSEY